MLTLEKEDKCLSLPCWVLNFYSIFVFELFYILNSVIRIARKELE